MIKVDRHPGPFIGPDAELARACAMAAIVDYGTDDEITHQRIIKDGIWNDHVAVQAALAAIHNLRLQALKPRPIAEYHEDMGDVLWWCWEKIPAQEGVPGTEGRGRWLGEPPYVGTPNDLGFTVQVETKVMTQADQTMPTSVRNFDVGGWPGYHTHFTPLPPMPDAPTVTNGDRANG